ncbi:protein kinase family protein, partial [Legionella adelaidensis]
MPTPYHGYPILMKQYNQLPWYKKAGFWLSAPRLAWGLFGYRKNPDENRVMQLIQWAKASWFFKTKFEQYIYTIIEPVIIEPELAVNTHSNYSETIGNIADVVSVIAEYVTGGAYGATSRFHREADTTRIRKITNQLLLAVAYGMESKEANIPVKPSDV